MYLTALKTTYLKKQDNMFARILKKANSELKKGDLPLNDFYTIKYELSRLDYNMHYWNCTDDIPKKYMSTYQDAEKLHEFQMLQLELKKISNNYTYQIQIEPRELNIKSKDSNILLFKNVYDLFFKEKKILEFNFLLKTLEKNDLPNDDKRFACITILDILIHDELKGKYIYTKERFRLYEFMRNEHLLLVNGIISNHLFDSIVHQSCLLKEYDYASSFINEYQVFLKKSIKEDTVAFNVAMIYVYKKEYKLAQRVLLQVNLYDFKFDFKVTALLLKIYFNNNEYELFNKTISSLKAKINRNLEISNDLKKQLSEFLNVATLIMQTKSNKSELSQNNYNELLVVLKKEIIKKTSTLGKADILQVLNSL